MRRNHNHGGPAKRVILLAVCQKYKDAQMGVWELQGIQYDGDTTLDTLFVKWGYLSRQT